jgi:hypothetical protein
MKITIRRRLVAFAIALISIGAMGAIPALAQKSKGVFIQATALGTSTQSGRIISIDLRISDYSTAEDRAALVEAFGEKGSEGLANALEKMNAKGRLAVTGTLGFDVNFIRQFTLPDGSVRYRFVTDRPILFGEVWSSSRSMDYSLSMGEIVISKDKKKSSGTLYPAARFTLDKEKDLVMETFQNPWKLVNIVLR